MAKYTTPIQPLILVEAGVKPTIPNPATIMPTDPRFNNTSNLMIGQLAYNVPDDIWYYRSYSAIKKLTGSTVLDVNDVEVWRNDKIYQAGNTFVSYVNADSSDPQFQTAAIYRCTTTTLAGESPESAQVKWELQGATVDNSQISFLDLIDTPTSYTGLSNKFVAINQTEDGLTFIDAPQSETITLDTVEVYDDTKAYTAGNTFVSYVNPGSTDSQFQVEAIYRCSADTVAGESPEDTPSKWVYQGQEVTVTTGNTSNTIVKDLDTLRALTGYDGTDSVFVKSEKAWYKFNVSNDSGEKANDYDAVDNPGSWLLNTNLVSAQGESVIYGYLYKRAAVIDSRSISSSGWSVPTKADWGVLRDYIGSSTAGNELKGTRVSPEEHPRWTSGEGIDTFNFAGYPSGYVSYSGPSYTALGVFGTWWASDDSNDGKVLLSYASDFLTYFIVGSSDYNYEGHAVRLFRSATTDEQNNLTDGEYAGDYIGNDSKSYKTVKIGTQIWMAENLAETRYANGDTITLSSTVADFTTDTSEARIAPNEDSNLVATISDGLLHPVSLSGDYQDLINKPGDIGGIPERAIVTSETWDGTLYNIDLSEENQYKLVIDDLVVSIALGLTFPIDASTNSREVVIIIDNSQNTETITSIVFDDNSGSYTWNWSVGDPITGIAAGAVVELWVRNRSDVEVKALTDVEA